MVSQLLKGHPGPTLAAPEGSSTSSSVPAAHGHVPLEAPAPGGRAPVNTQEEEDRCGNTCGAPLQCCPIGTGTEGRVGNTLFQAADLIGGSIAVKVLQSL